MAMQIYTIEDNGNGLVLAGLNPTKTVSQSDYYSGAVDALEYPTQSSAQSDCNIVGNNFVVVGPHPRPHH